MRAHKGSVKLNTPTAVGQVGRRLLQQDNGYSKKFTILTLLFVSLLGGTLLLSQHKAEAVSTAVLNYEKPTIVANDTSCQTDLATQRGVGGTARTQVNKSDPYREIYWITPGGNAASNITATAGSTAAIPLQLNGMDFICAILTNPNYNTTTAQAATVVTNSNFPNDRAPNPDSSTPLAATIDAASRYELHTYIAGATLTAGPAGGKLSGVTTGDVLISTRSNSSRYWGSNVEPFTYTPPAGGLPSGTTQITIQFKVERAYVYHANYRQSGADTTCTKPGTAVSIDPGETNIDWSKCAQSTVTVTFNVTAQNPKLTLNPGPSSCTAITGSAVDGDSPNTQIRIDIYEGSTTTSPTYRQYTMHTTGTGHTFSANLSDVIKGNTQASGTYNPYPSPATGVIPAGGANAHPGASTDWAQQKFYVYAIGVDSTGHEVTPNSSAEIDIGPCAKLACTPSPNGTNFSLGAPGVPVNFSVNISELNSAVATLPPGTQTFTVKVTGTGPGTNSQTYNSVPDVAPGGPGGKIYSNSMTFTPAASGSYSVSWTYSYNGLNCSDTSTAAYTPYFSVNGGDITAGPGFGGSCADSDNDSADIESWNINASPYAGAGSQLGAIATGDITNFVSGLGLSGGTTTYAGHGLSFSNASGTIGGTGQYGGQFGTTQLPCLTDAYSAATGATSTTVSGVFSGSDVPAANTGVKNLNITTSKLTIGSGAPGVNPISIPNGVTINLYVAGNVYIEDNITYAPYSITNVPRFNLYVSGSIYIDPNVGQLHGAYVAQKADDGSGGDIDTCATSTTNLTLPYATCATQLTVVGAVEAEDQLALTRTYGNLATVGAVPAAPAEIFQYSPELWMNVPAGSNPFGIQSYTSLPPVL